jgi:gamma-glutamyl-gamma-aminobutyrate hydrolase PuuD
MNVYIVNGNQQYIDMWINHEHTVVDSLEKADVVQFTGGEDVSPELYGQSRHFTTRNNELRDTREMEMFDACLHHKIPMVGICRGGQFLNVMCGGTLYQNVDGHATGDTHLATDVVTGDIYDVSSTHHQMMRAGEEGTIIGIAAESSKREYMNCTGDILVETGALADTEVVVYPESGVLCFQPHPEFFGEGDECQEWYFDLLERELGIC